MTKIIFLNGPPRSGKDQCAQYLEFYCAAMPLKFATPIYNGVAGVFGLDPMQWAFFYENAKETPLPQLQDFSPREAMIWMSEDVMKPMFGEDYFGINFCHRAKALGPDQRISVSDSGFVDEALAVIDEFGAENCLLIRLHRPGHSFDGDSRSYINLPCGELDVTNDEDLDALRRKIVAIGVEFFTGEVG